MAATTLVSTLLMGLVLLVIVAGVLRLRNWRREAPVTLGKRSASVATDVVYDPDTWGIVFFLVAVGITAGALVFVGGLSVPGMDGAAVGQWLIAAFGVLIAGMLFGGIYSGARSRGAARSLAIALGTSVLGLLFIVGIAVHLLISA